MMLEKILNYEFLGNAGLDYLIAIGVFLALSLVFYLAQKIILNKIKKVAEKTETDLDDFLLKVIQNIKPPSYIAIAFYIAFRSLTFTELVGQIVYGVFIIAVVFQIVLILQRVIDYAVKKRIAMLGNGGKDEEAMTKLISQIIKFTLWIVGALLVLSNLGIDVTSLVAGFGIGGIAVALAVQSVLKDMFASFSIFVDKPFKVGDSIKAGTDSGTVQKIGIKTTTVKTLTGNELTIPNKDLTDSRIHNLKRIEKRRSSFSLGFTYDTGSEKLKKIPEMIKSIIESVDDTEFGRAHFKSFGDSSLNFEIAYFINTPEYAKFMDVQHKINLKIYERFEQEGIEFAYPTQTVFLNKEQ